MRRMRVRAGDRFVSYCEFGDAAGDPVVALHGNPASASVFAFLAHPARRVGCRVIAIDRPAIASTDPWPGYSVPDAVGDVAAVLDALEIERAAVLGHSGGGPYALGAAALVPGRVVSVATVGSMAPPGVEERERAYSGLDRLAARVARRAPLVLDAAVVGARIVIRRAHATALRQYVAVLGVADREVFLSTPSLRSLDFVSDMTARHARGASDDYRATGTDWRFDLATIDTAQVPVALWHGTDDRIVDVRMVDELARRIPGARVRRCDGEGHFLLVPHADDVLRGLVARRA